jgi:hypothetical protein
MYLNLNLNLNLSLNLNLNVHLLHPNAGLAKSSRVSGKHF